MFVFVMTWEHRDQEEIIRYTADIAKVLLVKYGNLKSQKSQ